MVGVNSWIKNIMAVLISLIVILLVLTFGSFQMLKSSLPEYSGVLKVQKLSDKVEIYRDDRGIPYIHASTEFDVYFALGYIHAQERLFQMDLNRRAGEGRLSEVFGNNTSQFDKLFRTLDLKGLVENNFNKYDDLTKNILKSYADGVNEFILNSPEKFTIEFDILGYKPYKWQPEHSLLIAKLMAWELNISWWSDIAITHLIQKLGSEKAAEILPNFDENGPTIIPDELKKYSNIPTDLIEIDKKFRKFIGAYGTHIGSNNWIVDGSRSNSGKPIIANDPHLSFTVPGKWYVVSIKSPTINSDGFTLPGIPGMVIGKNENISWAVTNIMADDADFYLEEFDSTNSNYYFDNEWHQLQIIFDTIKVKDSSDVIFEIRKNHRGPIVSGVHNYNRLFPNDYQKESNISMRWTGLDYSNEILAFYNLNRSQNWKDFRNSLELFHTPGQNFIYGDIEGNIGYLAAVKLPKRKNNSTSFVYDGTTSKYDWEGYIPFDQNPKIFNPSQGFLASANNKVVSNYPYHISNIWEPVSRITRIKELLESNEKHSVEDFEEYQNDFFSHYAKDMIPYILDIFEADQSISKNVNTALKILKQWDYNMTAESQVATIYAAYYQFLLKNIFYDEMGENLFKEYIFLANIPLRVTVKILKENSTSWFDNINTEQIETRDDIIRKSFIDAIDFLENEISKDIKYWQWGKLHQVTFKHFFHGFSGLIDHLLDIGPFQIGGDGTTVFNTEYSFTAPYENRLGPSMRYIFDFSKPNKFEFILPTGQSGHFFSDHYNDMTKYWLEGKYITVNTNIDSVRQSAYDLLVLIPDS